MSWGNEQQPAPATAAATYEISTASEVTKEQLIALWYQADQNARMFKAEEARLRREVIERCFDATKEKGSESIPLPDGWLLKCTKKLDYKLDSEKVSDVLNNHFSEDLASLLVRWSATLSLTNYEALSDESKALFDGVLTIKPAMPSLEAVPPKVKK